MASADIIVVTVPGGGANTAMINAAALAAMKPTGIFVNIARGDVVDEPALIAALQAGQIAGAGLDVFAKEPVVPDAFRAMENVVLLPHLGTAALEVREAMGQMALDNIIAWDEGRPLPQAV
jgi:lactate dehydrogenase-like 2-hydroxyacid dehydrogenase